MLLPSVVTDTLRALPGLMETEADVTGVNWLAVVVAAVRSFMNGGFWYGPLLGKVVYVFDQRPLSHRAVNAGDPAVALALVGVVLGVWP